MPKKLKLNLDGLKVQSFITALTDEEKNKFKGGGTEDSQCESACVTCTACGSCATFCVTCSPSWCSGNCC